MANKQARALVDGEESGVKFRCNDVVEADAKVIKDLEKGGVVDSAPEAVAYALGESSKVVSLLPVVEEPTMQEPVQQEQQPLA